MTNTARVLVGAVLLPMLMAARPVVDVKPIRGVTKRVVVPATAVFYEKGAGRFRGQFAINRKDYGVAFDSPVNPIEHEVQVQWDMAISEPKPAAK